MSIKHMTSMMPRALHNTGSIRPNAISSHPKRQCRSHAFTDNVDPTHSPVDDSDYRRNVHHDDPTHYSPPMPDLTPSLIVADYLNHRIQMMCHTMTSSAYIDTMMCHTATLIAPGQITSSPSHLQFLASTTQNMQLLASLSHPKHATSCILIAHKTLSIGSCYHRINILDSSDRYP
eukprot:351531_1